MRLVRDLAVLHYLPLHTFKVRTLMELDHALYLLNFDRIELGLSAAGDWGVYYRYPCRFLDRSDFSCRIHNTPEQPQICIHYNPYQCWYRRVLTRSVSDDFLRVDRSRLEYIVGQFAFDDAGNIVEAPEWASWSRASPTCRPRRAPRRRPAGRGRGPRWKEFAAGANGARRRRRTPTPTWRTPATVAGATAVGRCAFPTDVPETRSGLDFLRFVLGFPGVELAVADGAWSLVVRTTCRHLEGNRCSIYGRPERPLLCKYYDAWKCTYKAHFGLPRPTGFLRVGWRSSPG